MGHHFAYIEQTRSQVIQEAEYIEAFNSLQSLGDVNQITVDVAAMELPSLWTIPCEVETDLDVSNFQSSFICHILTSVLSLLQIVLN